MEQFPSRLKKANITPNFEKRDTEYPLNYRITLLTPALEKIFETLLKSKLSIFYTTRGYYQKHSLVFGKKISTIAAHICLNGTVRADLNSQKFVAAAFLDLSKSF